MQHDYPRQLLWLLLAASLATCGAHAQSYPAKQIRMVVGFPPGGTNDILARIVAQKLGENVGHPVIVDNKAGANGIVGSELVAKAAPDGYTLLLQSVVHAINAGLYKKLPYNSIADFAPVILLASGELVLVVHPALPVKSVRDLIALARARPGELNYGSTGTGSSVHLAMELFKTQAGLQITHVPYKGAGPATTELLSGQIPMMFAPLLPTLPHINAGKLRALAAAGARRPLTAPAVPTVQESGLKDFEASAWFGLFAPANTPREVIARLNGEMMKILQAPGMRERLSSQGVEPLGSTPEEFAAYLKAEIAKWGKVIQISGARAE